VAKKTFGSLALSGLNIKSGAHLIADHELVESVNGWTDEDGVWSVAKRPERLYSGSDIVAYEAGRMNGADHHVWLDGSTLYDNGANVGTINGAGDTMEISAIDDQFLITGATKSHIYDGDHVRGHGTWQPEELVSTGYNVSPADSFTISAVTQSSDARVTVTLAHPLAVGDSVWITGVTEMPQLNDKVHIVTAIDAGTMLWFEIEWDTSAEASAGTTGTAYPYACGITGAYNYYLVTTVELTDGTVLTSKPRGLAPTSADKTYSLTTTWEPIPITLAPTDKVLISFTVNWLEGGAAGADQLYPITGAVGVDYTPGVRLYRTKADGYDIYQQEEWEHGDAALSIGTGNSSYSFSNFLSKMDDDIVVVLPYGFNDHTSAPATEIATFAGQRVFVAVGKYLHWSSFDGIEYFSDAGNILMWDTITALGSYRDYCIVFSADRMWAVRMIDGVPDVEEIDTPVGTTYPLAVEQTSMGLMFLREDGLWMFAGGTVDKISRRAFPDILSPKSVSLAGDVLYVSGSEQAFVSINRGDSWIWHESSHVFPFASATSGKLYGATTFSVEQLFLGARTSGSFKTKSYGAIDLTMMYKLEMDIEGDSIPNVVINGNIVSDTDWHLDETPYSFPGRRIIWTWLPQILSNYVEIECEVSGDVKAFGLRGFQKK